MKKREHYIDDRKIEIYDDIFSMSERSNMYHFACNSSYTLDRSGSSLPEFSEYNKTLRCLFTVTDIINFNFFKNSWILNYLKENNLRVNRVYINLCTASDTYQYHVDTFTKNVPTMLYYLNLKWDPTWEGETHFSNDNMGDILCSSGFIPGRLVVFDGTIPHKSSQPAPGAKYYRLVLAVKLTNNKDFVWDNSINVEDFIYDKNITVTEHEKECLYFIGQNTKGMQHSGITFTEHLFNTFCILKHLNASPEVCLAGLFHSIYGTEFYKNQVNVKEPEVINLIGEYANSLIKMFSQENRLSKMLNNAFNLDKKQQSDLLLIEYANSIEMASRNHNQNNMNLFATLKNKIDSLK
jgi:hypothetical protein